MMVFCLGTMWSFSVLQMRVDVEVWSQCVSCSLTNVRQPSLVCCSKLMVWMLYGHDVFVLRLRSSSLAGRCECFGTTTL
jgi:hypothetical protein